MKNTAILFFNKHKATFYDVKGESSSAVLKDDVFRNGEIIDREKFQRDLDTLLEGKDTKKLFITLGTDLTFEKEVPNGDVSSQQSEFLDMVPFERVLSKTFKFKKEEVVVATNNDFVEEIMAYADSNGMQLIGIVTESIVQKMLPDEEEFNNEVAFKKLSLLVKYSLVYFEENEEKGITLTLPDVKNPRFLALTGTFAVLLIVLVMLITMQFIQQNKFKHIVNIRNSTNKILLVSPTATPSASTPTPLGDTSTPSQQ